MKVALCIVMILALLAQQGAAAGDFDYLVEIIPNEFDKLVTQSPHVWLVHSTHAEQEVLDELKKTAEALGGVFRVGYLNLAGVEKAGVDTSKKGTTSFYGDDKENPLAYVGYNKFNEYVKFVLANTKYLIDARSKSARSLKEYQQYQEREAQRMEKEANDEAKLREKSDTILLSASTFRDVLMKSREPYAVNIYVANVQYCSIQCSACMYLNREWEQVSAELKGKIKVAKVNLTEHSELEQLFELKDFPVVRFYPGGIKKLDNFVDFSGTKKKFTLIEWILKSNDKQGSNNDLAELRAEDYKAVCKEGKGTCVIFFLEGEDNAYLVGKLSALPNNYLKKPISFFYVTKDKQDAFAKQFGVLSYPNVLMTYCHRKTYWRLDHLDLAKVEEAVGEVLLGNRNNFVKYKFEEALV